MTKTILLTLAAHTGVQVDCPTTSHKSMQSTFNKLYNPSTHPPPRLLPHLEIYFVLKFGPKYIFSFDVLPPSTNHPLVTFYCLVFSNNLCVHKTWTQQHKLRPFALQKLNTIQHRTTTMHTIYLSLIYSRYIARPIFRCCSLKRLLTRQGWAWTPGSVIYGICV